MKSLLRCTWVLGLTGSLAGMPVLAQSFFLQASTTRVDGCFGQTLGFQAYVRSNDGYTAPVKLTFPDLPAGLHVVTVAPNPVVPGAAGNVNIAMVKVSGSEGLQEVIVQGNGSNQQTAQVAVQMNLLDRPAVVTPRDPVAFLSTGVSPVLEWDSSPTTAQFQHVQVATQPGFEPADIVYENVVLAQQFVSFALPVALNAGQTYYWRVSGINACGTGNWSAVAGFITDGMLCQPLDLTLGDGNGSEAVVNLILPNGARLDDIDVQVSSNHRRSGDLDIRIAHAGEEVQLLAPSACAQPGIAARFDDAAGPAAGCASGGNAVLGEVRPAQSLAAFAGHSGNGPWQLRVRDTVANGQTGALRGVCLRVRNSSDSVYFNGME